MGLLAESKHEPEKQEGLEMGWSYFWKGIFISKQLDFHQKFLHNIVLLNVLKIHLLWKIEAWCIQYKYDRIRTTGYFFSVTILLRNFTTKIYLFLEWQYLLKINNLSPFYKKGFDPIMLG